MHGLGEVEDAANGFAWSDGTAFIEDVSDDSVPPTPCLRLGNVEGGSLAVAFTVDEAVAFSGWLAREAGRLAGDDTEADDG